MMLSEKIIGMRNKRGMSQEQLAEAINVSRQAVSRWEVGSALPDASNILALCRLFGVTADFLLNDEYSGDKDVTALKSAKRESVLFMKRAVAFMVSLLGLAGNFIIYVLSRIIEVHVPFITHDESGQEVYNWSNTGRSYKYFIQEYRLEFLVALFWAMVILGLVYLAAKSGLFEKASAAIKKRASATKNILSNRNR